MLEPFFNAKKSDGHEGDVKMNYVYLCRVAFYYTIHPFFLPRDSQFSILVASGS